MRFHVTKEMRAELQALNDQNGKLSEAMIIQASKRKSSAFHSMFLWDDEREAARQGRLVIARSLICSVRILPSEAKTLQCSVKIRKFHGLGAGYKDINEIAKSKDLRKALLDRALEELDSLRQRYGLLKELDAIFEALDRAKRNRRRRK